MHPVSVRRRTTSTPWAPTTRRAPITPAAMGEAAQPAGPVIWRSNHAPRRTVTLRRRLGRSLLAAPVRARPEARRSSLERTATAIAGSRNVRTGKARQPGLPGRPRGSRVRTDHTSQSSPAPCRSAAGPRGPARCTVLICSPLHICVPAWPLVRPPPPPPTPELVRPAAVIVAATGRRRAPAGRVGGPAYRAPGPVPLSLQSGRRPCQIQARPGRAAPRQTAGITRQIRAVLGRIAVDERAGREVCCRCADDRAEAARIPGGRGVAGLSCRAGRRLGRGPAAQIRRTARRS
jgi:hypothetical protein